jgi:hypothetical protein
VGCHLGLAAGALGIYFSPPRCLAWVEAGEPLPAVTARTT